MNKRILVLQGDISAYIITRIKSSKSCNFNFLQGEDQFNSSPSNGQSNYPSLPNETGGDKKFDFNSRNQGNLGILHVSADHTYCPFQGSKTRKQIREVQKSSSKWILHKGVFQKIVKLLGQVDTDLCASTLCHQVPRYVSWHPGPRAWLMRFC